MKSEYEKSFAKALDNWYKYELIRKHSKEESR